MLYTEAIHKAMKIAYDAHHGQVDKSGVPYIFHPMHLAEQMDTEEEIIAALLHDVVEDSDITLNDLEKAGFSPLVLEAVSLLTHLSEDNYLDYVRRMKKNPLARKIKLADLMHNSNISRLVGIEEATRARLERYQAAQAILAAEQQQE